MRLIIILWVVLFWISVVHVCFADQKQDAIDHAITAAKIQSGETAWEQKIRKYGENQGIKYISKVGIEKELGAALYCVKISRERSVTFKINNRETINLGMNKTELKISF